MGLPATVGGKVSAADINAIAFPPFCVLRKTANQSLTTSPAAIIWDVETRDDSGMHSNTVNNTRLIAPIAGLYEVTASVFNTNTAGFSTMTVRAIGTTTVVGSTDRRGSVGGVSFSMRTTCTVTLAATEYVEVMIEHSTATGAIEGGVGGGGATVTMKRIGS